MFTRTDPSLILTPDLRFNGDNLVTSDSTYTERNLEPCVEHVPNGIERPRSDAIALGVPAESFDGTLVTLTPGSLDSVGTFGYTNAAGVTYGRNSLASFQGFEVARSGADGYRKPQAVALDDGRILCVYENDDDNGTYVTRRATDGTWSQYPVWIQSDLYDANFAPCPTLTRNGSVVYCASMERVGSSPSDHVELRIDVSLDSGETWMEHVRHAIELAQGEYVDQMRLVYEPISQNMYLFAIQREGGPTYTMRWWRSVDLGASWSECAEVANAMWCDVCSARGRVILVTVEDGVTDAVQVYSVTPSGTLLQYDAIDVTVRPLVDAYVTIAMDESSVVRVYTRWDDTTDQYITAYQSTNGGRSFTLDGSILATACADGDGDLRPYSAVVARGTLWLMCVPHSGNVSTPQILAAHFGGITNVTFDADETWNSTALPTDSGWTNVGDAGSISQFSLNVAPVLLASYWTKSISIIQQSRVLLMHARVKASTNTSATNDTCVIRVRQDAPVANTLFSCSIRLGETQGKVYDNSGVTLATFSLTIDTFYDYCIAMDQVGVVSVWYKVWNSNTWTNACANQACTAISGTITQSDVTFGCLNTLSNSDSKWRFVSVRYQPFLIGATEEQLPAFDSATYEPLGIPCTTLPHYVAHGCSVQWRVPPETKSDEWVFRSVSRTSFERCLPASTVPSPAIWYDGDGDDATSYYATFDFSASFVSRLSRNLSWIGCVGVRGIESLELMRYNGSTYASIATLDLRESLTDDTTITRVAGSACFSVGTSGSTVSRLFPEDSLVGLYVGFTNASGAIVAGRVIHNRYGQIGPSETLWIDLDPASIVGTLSTFGTSVSGGSTAATVYHDCGAHVFAESADSTRYYRVRWTLAPFGSGLDRIGWFGAGAAHVLARTERSGATVEQTDGIITETLGSNVTIAHKVSQPRRVWTLNYEQLLLHPTRETGGSSVARVALGNTERGYEDNNRDIFSMIQRGSARLYPFLFVPGVYDWSDPGSSGADVLGADNVALVRMQDTLQSVTNRSRLNSRREVASTSANLTLTEEV